MPMFATAADLKSAIEDECGRAGGTFSANILGRFVPRAEQRIYAGGREPLPSQPVRVRQMEVTGALAFTAGEAALPTDFLEFKRINWTAQRVRPMRYVLPDEFAVYKAGGLLSGIPGVYTIEASKVLVYPSITGNVDATYYRKLTALTAEASTNAILTEFPDIYLSSCLLYAYRYLRDEKRASEAFADYVSACDAALHSDTAASYGGNTLAPMLRR